MYGHVVPTKEDGMTVLVNEAAADGGRVEIRDWSLWTKHVRGAAALVAMLEGLEDDQIVELVVDGHPGEWVKKKSSARGASTPGLKPVGKMRDVWFDWFKTRRGELVSVTLAPNNGPPGAVVPALPTAPARPAVSGLDSASTAERAAAWAAFEALSQAGWRRGDASETGRDALHDRGQF
jgi:hypothetical protein